MTIPVISSLPEIPAYSDANFETKAPAVLSALRNTFIAEMNAAIAAINAYNYGAAVNANIITGQVAVANGGTGLSELAAGRIPYGAGTGNFGNSENFVYSSGKLGIGVGAPLTSLSNVSADTATWPYAGSLFWRLDTANYVASFVNRNTSGIATGVRVHTDGADPANDYILLLSSGVASGTARLAVRGDGKTGIGTATPVKKLEVKDATGAQARLTHSAGSYTDFQTDGDGNLTIAPSGLSSRIGGVRWLKTPGSVAVSGATTYKLTITIPDASTQIAGEFFGFIRNSSNITAIHALRFMFHISKMTGDNITLALGAKETVDGTGVTIDTVTVHSVSATQAVIMVTMTGAATGTLIMYQGHLRLSELVNSVSSASWE